MRSAALLIIGNEILSGEVKDENGPWAIDRMVASGVDVRRVVTVPDERDTIAAEIRACRAAADAVIVSGGIGPTHDDETRPAIADALSAELEWNAEAEARIRKFYGDRLTDAELSMAEFPRGARLVSGAKTGTFGFEVRRVYALPGVPFLFHDLIDTVVLDFDGGPLHKRELRSDRREGEIAPHLADAQLRCGDVAIGSYPVCVDGVWHVRVVLRGPDPDRLDAVLRDLGALL